MRKKREEEKELFKKNEYFKEHPNLERPEHDCYLCELDRIFPGKYCENCVAIWGVSPNFCTQKGSPFKSFINLLFDENGYNCELAVFLARRIAYIPLDYEKIEELSKLLDWKAR